MKWVRLKANTLSMKGRLNQEELHKENGILLPTRMIVGIPFEGKLDLDEFLEWLHTVKRIFK